MCVHLITNASVLNSVPTFQNAVFNIHGLGKILPLVEWVFIFIPILFHAIFGVIIIRGGLPNHSTYRLGGNFRYSLQRASGMIAFAFIMWHVFHMHGWFHFDAWLNGVVKPLGGAEFAPYNAASSAATALQASIVVQILYAIGILACVFHLANGIWTMGITWGVWVTPAAQRWANMACLGFGILLGAVGLSALGGMVAVDPVAAKAEEDKMYEARVASGAIEPNEEKRSGGHDKEVADKPAKETEE